MQDMQTRFIAPLKQQKRNKQTKAVGPDTARRDQRAEKQRRHMEGQEEEGEEQEEEEGEEGAVAGLAERVARAGLDEALPAPPRSAHKVCTWLFSLAAPLE